MATLASHNSANASVKRILREAREIQADPSTEFTAGPLEDNLFDWHCTLRGPKDTEFEGGLYHVRITLPPQYPFRPPSLRVLTPSGRFEVDTPVCISFTNYHEELWQPAWGIRTAIIGLQGFFPVSGSNALGVGSLNAPPQERKRLAALSREWKCPQCNQKNIEMLPDPVETPKQEDGASSTESVETPKASLGPNVARQDEVQAPNHIALPAFSSTLPPNTLSTTTEANATALSLQPSTPARNIPIFELGPKAVALPSSDPARHGEEENGARASGNKSDTPQQHQVQAFPAFRDSGVEGVPIWLDSAIWILTALLGGIMIHRVMF